MKTQTTRTVPKPYVRPKCPHGRIRSKCKECGGSQICEHGRVRSKCKECGGGSICEHGRNRSRCASCSPQNACTKCLAEYVPKTFCFYPLCARCYYKVNSHLEKPRQFKVKEDRVFDAVKARFPELELWKDVMVDGGCSKRRPDIFIERLTHSVIVECDENQHRGAGYSCDNMRTMQLFEDLGSRPLVFIRFNPDSYRRDGVRVGGCFERTEITKALRVVKSEWDRRIVVLLERVASALGTIPEREVTVEKLFFDEE